MPARLKPGSGLSVSFDKVNSSPLGQNHHDVTGLRFTIKCQTRGEVDVDFTDFKPRRVVLLFSSACLDLTKPGGPWKSKHTIQNNIRCLKDFCRFLYGIDPATGIDDVQRSLLDAYVEHLKVVSTPASTQNKLGTLVVVFRNLSDRELSLKARELATHAQYLVGHNRRPPREPRDAYSDFVNEQLRRASSKDLAEFYKGIRRSSFQPHGEREAELAEQVREVILTHGKIRYDNPIYQELFWSVFYSGRDGSNLLNEFHREVFLFSDEIIPFLVFVSLQSGLEIECCKWLRDDCLEVVRAGYVEISYVKERARGAKQKSIIVRDGGINTVGGAIRAMLRLTEHARRHSDSKYIVCYYNQGRIWEGYRYAVSSLASWVDRHGIVDDDGKVLHLQLSRLRKSFKSESYKRAGGELKVFVQGHTKDVAANNYAQIPSHRGLHEQTVAEALGSALRSTTIPVRVVRESGDAPSESSWLAGCDDPTSGSHAPVGQVCRQPFWGCLNCTNARYSSANLPALLAFSRYLVERRSAISGEEWALVFGAAYRRIHEQILTQFSTSSLAEAQQASLCLDLYLPPEAFQ